METGQAFGLEVALPCPVPGLDGARYHPAAGRTTVTLQTLGQLDAAWPPGAPEVYSRALADGTPALTVHHDPGAGYRVALAALGAFVVSADGSAIACQPAPAGWPWSLLVAQALPLAALLQGLEVLHASAAELGGVAVALTGPPGVGKTSVALELAAAGAPLVADDVVAVESSPAELRVHPGPAVVNVSPGSGPAGALGEELGRDPGETGKRQVRVTGPGRPLRLARLYFLERTAGGELGIAPLRPVAPARLLGTTFVFVVRSPQRLMAHLDLCLRLAGELGVFRVTIPPPATPAQVAARIAGHDGDGG